MRSPVVVSNTASVTEADLLVGRLRSQGIDAVARTNLDRTTYAGLGGAVVLVDSDQRVEAELELILLESSVDADHDPQDADDGWSDEPTIGLRRRSWVRVCGYLTLTAMALGTVVPSAAVIWSAVSR